jgi:hypothetical protein
MDWEASMNAREASTYLAERGYPCAVATIRALVRSKQLHCYRPGVTRRGPMSFTTMHLYMFLQKVEFAEPDSAIAVKSTVPRKPRPERAAARVPDADWREDLKKVLGR